MKKTEEEIVKQILDVISEAGASKTDIVPILSLLLLSIGASLEGCDVIVSEDVLIRYASNPNLGNALMAQGLWMKETWSSTDQQHKGTEQNGTEGQSSIQGTAKRE